MAALVHTILVLTALMPVAVQSDHFWTWHCDTSGGSPTKADVIAAMGKMPTYCCQGNQSGNMCSRLSSWGSANIDYCDIYTGYNQCDHCYNIQTGLTQLINSCTANFGGVDLVGGWLDFDNDPKAWGNVVLVR